MTCKFDESHARISDAWKRVEKIINLNKKIEELDCGSMYPSSGQPLVAVARPFLSVPVAIDTAEIEGLSKEATERLLQSRLCYALKKLRLQIDGHILHWEG